MRRLFSLKYLSLILIMLLALYPIAELTRVITIDELIRHLNPEINIGNFYAEITIMWILYLCIIPAYLWITSKKGYRIGD